jgi:peptidyl-Lys metalloendopeptidase
MLKMRYLFTLLMAIAALGLFTVVASAAKSEAVVTVKVSKQAFSASEQVPIEVTIANPNKGSIRVLKWFTPVDDVEEPLFEVTRDGVKVDYLGAHYKRPEPTDADFIILKGGESITRTVDLAKYYDLSVTGDYSVSYDVRSFQLFKKTVSPGDQAEELKSATIKMTIEGRPNVRPSDPEASAVTGANSYSKCTVTQQSQVATARDDAAGYASNAENYLLAGTQTARYTTWFGTYSSARYTTVRDHFTKISNALDTVPMTFDCGCKKQYYAYVYPTQPYTIYLCRVYWTAPAKGTDSKAGTLIHETSHFNVVAATDDWVYGQSGAKSLAISDPAKAIDNADSHEYFAENTPAQ